MNKLTTKINALYFLTLAMLVIALLSAWKLLFIPFVEHSEQTKADLLLAPYVPIFEQIIDEERAEDLEALISSMMLLKDGNSDQPMLLKLSLDLVNKSNIEQINSEKESQFKDSSALFSPTTFELMGSLSITYNDHTYNNIIQNSYYAAIGAITICLLLFIVGQRILSFFIRPLSTLSHFLSDVDALHTQSIPKQNKRTSVEILNVWNATQVLLDRIRQRESDLKKGHEIAQQALKEKVEAETANKAKSSFLANMSHEIRTPLTAIIGFADSLLDENLVKEKRQNATHTIIRNGNHLLQIINDILDLSKIESDKLEIENIEVSPVQLIKETEVVFKPIMLEKDLSFVINYNFPLPKVITSDPTRLRQILFNLLSNAKKFTDKGKIKLSIAYNSDSELLLISVQDSGIGLDTAESNKIFQPFSQADVSTTRKYGGTGLGLSISRRLAQMLGGDLTFTSVKGEGTIFTLSVSTGPVAELIHNCQSFQIGQVDAISETDASALAGNVLIAEDTPDIQELLKFHLDGTAIKLTFANNGQEAVEFALAAEYDVVLMDMQMPILDGLGATKELRDNGYRKPIIAVTANAMREDRERYKVSGLDDFIAKPIDKNQLYAVLRKYLKNVIINTNSTTLDAKEEKKRQTKQRLTERFLNRLPEWLSDISTNLKSRNGAELVRAAHVLKGLGGSFGHPEITNLSKMIEANAKVGEFDSADQIFAELEEYCNKIEK